MAEFCLDCLNEMDERDDPKHRPLRERDVVLLDDFCDGCCEWKPTVVKFRTAYILREWLSGLLFPRKR